MFAYVSKKISRTRNRIGLFVESDFIKTILTSEICMNLCAIDSYEWPCERCIPNFSTIFVQFYTRN